MINQDDTSGKPFDINKLQWALRHGQKIDGVENIMLSSQPIVPITNHMGNSVKKDSDAGNIPLHNTVIEDQFEQLSQSLNREIISLKGEFAIVAQGTAVEEKIDQLGQMLNQEILLLKSELANLAQGTAVEEQIDKLGQSLNQEILSLKSELIIVTQDMAVEEEIDKLGQSLNQEILSLKSELAIVAQGTAVEEQIEKLGKYMSQEILSLRNEFAIFIQTQLNQEQAWKIADVEWKNNMKGYENQLQAEIRETQDNMLRKLDEHFQFLDAQLQNHDKILRQDLSLLTSKLAEIQQAQSSKEALQVTPWHKKLEERQTRLIEDMDYIQYVLEEIATRPQNNEVQQKLREKFFIREISALKEEMSAVYQKWSEMGNGHVMTEVEQYNKNLAQKEMNLSSEDQTKVYEKKRKRRH